MLNSYADAQVYLLDDCLSALDAHVARNVYERCILGHLKAQKKTVLFVTNRMEFVESSDSIVCMDHGHIAAQGDLEHVKASSAKLRTMLASVSNVDDEAEHDHTGDDEYYGPTDVLPPVCRRQFDAKPLFATLFLHRD